MSVLLALCCAGALLGGCDDGVGPQYCVSPADCDAGEYCNLQLGLCVPGVCPRVCTGLECGLDPICGESCGTCTAPETCTAATGQCECAPVCTGRACGPDPVCGQSCGTCGVDETCDVDGVCHGGCVPNCAGMECGSDGCSGSCGECGAGETCDGDGICQGCTADCTGKACGDDGCNGSCGTCGVDEICNASFQCEPVCTPDCAGKECGSDGCRGTCGTCDAGAGEVCVLATSQCEVCVPDCTGRVCGPDPTCGASCGDCQADEVCNAGVCECVPDCLGLECGDDGCGGSCGSCLVTETCSESGICECTEDCTNRECGLDPVCGYSCGTCGVDEVCSVDGTCIADCVPDCAGRECGPDPTCNTSCGTCPGGETCDAAGQCGCAPNCAGKECGDDGCGGQCGTCTAPQTCDANGACVCVPDCGNLECGNDPVCGQLCGTCIAPDVCQAGACVCVPDCGTRECGVDPVCGTSCGTCQAGETCDASGQCQTQGGLPGDLCTDDAQCAGGLCLMFTATDGYCGSVCDCNQGTGCDVADPQPICLWGDGNDPPQTCYCGYECPNGLTDCPDNGVGWQCLDVGGGYMACVPGTCVPDCTGRECGPDGCGGSCGTCQAGEACDGAGQCQAGQAGTLGDPCPFGNVNTDALACDEGLGFFCVGIPEDPAAACASDQDCIDLGYPTSYNPDCVTGATTGCGASFCSQYCDANGACPAGWEPYYDDDGVTCLFCVPTIACTPDCTGRECGDDGCGGSCGSCVAPEVCDASGQCVPGGAGLPGDLCTDDTQCAGGLCLMVTATDGYCGSTCDCNQGTGCDVADPQPICLWGDGQDPPVTCYCGYECPNGLTDCPNNGVGWQCVDVGGGFMACLPGACQPDCTGRACGDDGCGGSCGTCGANETCNVSGQCIPDNCTEALLDGSFEAAGAGAADWTMFSSAFGTPLYEYAALAHTGSWILWIGGGAADDAYAEQSVVIPVGTATVSAYILIDQGVAADYFRITVDGTEVARVAGDNATYANAYGMVSADVSAYANGAAHLIRLHGVITTATGSILVDDASLLACGGGPVGRLMLSEVLYDSQGGDDGNEWIEIFNGTASAIDLSTYSLGNGGNNYLGSVVQLAGTIPAGGCFVVGGPNGGFAYNQTFNFAPDLENSGAAADGVALFNVPAASLTAATVPIDAVIYGTNNSNNLLDETGAAGNVDVGDAGSNQSIERTGAGWAIQATPTPTVCNLP
ncbi:MAG TPA: lamin tail domain-containing protein [Myxococcota bacterium]|nr:lamin tail domain-containing protein [Myxococcota bacterium]